MRFIGTGIVALLVCAGCISGPGDGPETGRAQSALSDGDYSGANAPGYTIIGIKVTQPTPDLIKTQLVVQPGTDPLNQINVTRLRKLGSAHVQHPVMVAGPFGFGMPYYEINDNGYASSWVAQLALHDYDVWVTDDRTTKSLQLGTCDTGAVNCSIMSTWNIATKVADESFTRTLVARFHPLEQPVMTGDTGGAIAAIATVNAHPGDYAGLLSYQGALTSNDPAVRAYNGVFCGALTNLFNSGVIFDASSVGLITLAFAAQNHPNDPAPPIPGLPPGLTNLQAYLLTLTVHQDSPQEPTPTWTITVGDYQAGTLTYSSLTELFGLNPLFTYFLPIATFKEALCALAGTDTQYIRNLGQFRGDVLFFGSEFAFGPLGADNAALFTSARSTQVVNIPSRGEIDIFFNRDRETLSDPIVFNFLSQVFRN